MPDIQKDNFTRQRNKEKIAIWILNEHIKIIQFTNRLKAKTLHFGMFINIKMKKSYFLINLFPFNQIIVGLAQLDYDLLVQMNNFC